MKTHRIIRALGVALLVLVVLASTSNVAYADKHKRRRDRDYNSKGQCDRHEYRRRHRRPSKLWLNFDREIYRDYQAEYYSWVPGRYETRVEKVLVEPGHYETIRIPARRISYYDRRRRRHSIVVTPARKERIWVPARYENRKITFWTPGYYARTFVRRRPLDSGLCFSFRF